MKPRIKPGMKNFVGCAIGEKRSGWLRSCNTSSTFKPYQDLLKTGYLQIVDEDRQRIWLGLTAKGKAHVQRLESFYAQQL